MRSPTTWLVLLTLAACGGDAPEATSETPATDASAGTPAADGSRPALLPVSRLPDPCDILTPARAAELLRVEESEVMAGNARADLPPERRLGLPCLWSAHIGNPMAGGESRSVNLNLKTVGTRWLDSERDDPEAMARNLSIIEPLADSLEHRGSLAGGRLYADGSGTRSHLIFVPGIRAEGMTPDQGESEVLVTATLMDGRSHEERLAALRGLVEAAASALGTAR